jgi:hypothetical protein
MAAILDYQEQLKITKTSLLVAPCNIFRKVTKALLLILNSQRLGIGAVVVKRSACSVILLSSQVIGRLN